MQQPLEIGDSISISRSLASRYCGQTGVILHIERDPHGRVDWDMCTVHLEIAGMHRFPAVQLEKIALPNRKSLSKTA
jgi:hypothetical protein